MEVDQAGRDDEAGGVDHRDVGPAGEAVADAGADARDAVARGDHVGDAVGPRGGVDDPAAAEDDDIGTVAGRGALPRSTCC